MQHQTGRAQNYGTNHVHIKYLGLLGSLLERLDVIPDRVFQLQQQQDILSLKFEKVRDLKTLPAVSYSQQRVRRSEARGL